MEASSGFWTHSVLLPKMLFFLFFVVYCKKLQTYINTFLHLDLPLWGAYNVT